MKIRENLPQFEEEKALIIASGSQSARLYGAHKGMIEELDEVKVDDPKYTDREGYFEHRGGGTIFGSGSVYEPKNDTAHMEFLRELNERLEHLRANDPFDAIILLAPQYISRSIAKHLPSSLSRSAGKIIDGNYVKHHPFELLELIEKEGASK